MSIDHGNICLWVMGSLLVPMSLVGEELNDIWMVHGLHDRLAAWKDVMRGEDGGKLAEKRRNDLKTSRWMDRRTLVIKLRVRSMNSFRRAAGGKHPQSEMMLPSPSTP